MSQQLKAYLISLLRLFGVGVLGQYILINKSPFELDFADGKIIVAAGIAAVVFSLANALNPADKRYGIGAPAAKELSAGDVATNTDPGEVHIDLTTVVALVLLAIIALALLGVIGPAR